MSKYLVTDEEFLRIKAAQRLRKLLQKEHTVYQQQAHRRCGVGLTIAAFDEVVQDIINGNWCTAKTGANGAVLLTFTEVFKDVKLPEDREVDRLTEEGIA
jgi:hypothetical protein